MQTSRLGCASVPGAVSRIQRSTVGAICVAVAAATGVSLAVSAPAEAIYHSWDGTRGAGNRLTDPGNAQPWHRMTFSNFAPTGTFCAKGQDGGGGIRSFVCAAAAFGDGKRCDIGSPTLTAYVYGTGYSGGAAMAGGADTTGPC